jgi:inhibitor of cysteine peptidase
MRRILALAATLILAPALAAEGLRLRAGEVRVFELTENPSTGYSWRLDAAASRGLDHVSITDLGHRPGASMPGAPGTRRWRIRGLAPGRATMVFAYQRSWEPASVKTHRLEAVVTR